MSSETIATRDSAPRKILRWPAVQERVGKSRSQVWRDVKAGRFPAPVQLGSNAIGWYEDEVDAYQAALQRVTYAPPVQANE